MRRIVVRESTQYSEQQRGAQICESAWKNLIFASQTQSVFMRSSALDVYVCVVHISNWAVVGTDIMQVIR